MNTMEVMQALATALGTPELQLDARGCARLRVDDAIDINFEASGEHLVHVYCTLGSIPTGNKERVYERLLTANLFCAETGGATVAIDREFGEIVLCMDIGNHGWTGELIQSRVQRFMDAALAWRERFSDIETLPSTPVLDIGMPNMGVMLRA